MATVDAIAREESLLNANDIGAVLCRLWCI